LQQIVIPQDADDPGPLEGGEGGFHRAAGLVVDGNEARRLAGPEHEVRKTFGAVGEVLHDKILGSGHRRGKIEACPRCGHRSPA
jgi:hypothetical protein